MKRCVLFPITAVLFVLLWGQGSLKAQAVAALPEQPGYHFQAPAKKEKIDLKALLQALEKEYKVFFTYSDKIVDGKKVAYQLVSGQDLEELLNRILSPIGLQHQKVRGKFYVITEKAADSSKKKIKNNIGKRQISRQMSALRLLSAPPPPYLRPPVFTVEGIVNDEAGEPLIGVNILVKGSSKGTVTDIDGRFSLELSDGQETLVASYLGYETVEVPVQGRQELEITLNSRAASLEEVVVVGYGTQKRSDLTGSLASLSGEKLTEVPTASIDQALQGRVAGVNIIKDSGAPGGGVTVQIRGINSINGSNAPLYVIDGFPVTFDQGSDVSGLAQLNPGDIESIDILKDASATAIYGTRGANGVVLITTKKGRYGRTNLEFSTFQGFNTVDPLEVMNTAQFAQVLNQLSANLGNPPLYPDINALPDVDYQDEILRDGSMRNYQLAYTHGNEKTQYSLIGSLYDEKGVVVNSDFRRYTLRFNAAHRMNEKIQVGNNLTVAHTDYNIRNTTGRGGLQNGAVLQSALLRPPNAPIRDSNGNYVYSFESFIGDNPVSLVREPSNDRNTFTVLGNIFLNYEIVKNLTLRLSLGANVDYTKNNSFFPSSTLRGSNVDGSASVSTSQNINWLSENTLNYKFNVGNAHRFDLLAGYTLQQNAREFLLGSGEGFPAEEFEYNNLGAATLNIATNTNKTQWGLASYLFRTNYSLLDKYLFTFTVRADGSSRFGSDNRWGVFPSGAFAWRISEEPFLSNLSAVSDMKLRLGYGVTGNQPVQLYGPLALLTNNHIDYVFNGNRAVAIAPAGLGNPNLGWETSSMFNIGLDLGLFNNRLNFTLDVYQKTTDDLLFSLPLPEHLGLGSVLQNIGSVENNGVELSVNGLVLDGPLRWNLGLNFSRNRNTVTQLVGDEDILRGAGPNVSAIDNFNLLREGQPMTTFFGYQIDGVYQTEEEALQSGVNGVQAGDLIRRDINGDGVINDDDRMIIGDAQPDYILGLNSNLNYKSFDLSILVNGVFGNDLLNMNRFELLTLDGTNNMLAEAINYWNGPGTSNTIPRLGANVKNQSTSLGLEDGSFIRLRNITLGYTLPEITLRKLGGFMKSLRVYVTGQNLITITDYSGFDPEVNAFANNNDGNANIQGLDYGTYPRPRTFLAGLSVQF